MYTVTFEDQPLDGLLARVQTLRHEGTRFVQLCAEGDAQLGIDLIYTFYDEVRDHALNLVVRVGEGDEVPSIQGLYFAAFSYENETHDLFGVRFANMKLDFGGHFFNVAGTAPMTVITPEQKAAREKAAKLKAAAAAKAAKAAKAALEKAEAEAAEKALAQTPAEADAEAVAKVAAHAGKSEDSPVILSEAPAGKGADSPVILSEAPAGREVEGSPTVREGDPSTPGANAPSAQDDEKGAGAVAASAQDDGKGAGAVAASAQDDGRGTGIVPEPTQDDGKAVGPAPREGGE